MVYGRRHLTGTADTFRLVINFWRADKLIRNISVGKYLETIVTDFWKIFGEVFMTMSDEAKMSKFLCKHVILSDP